MLTLAHAIAMSVPGHEPATTPPAEQGPSASGWTLDPRVAETPGQFIGCPNGQRNAAESECLTAVQEAAQGLPVRGLRVADEGADGVVPGGCSYSRASKRAMFNRNPAGRSSSLYELVCIDDGAETHHRPEEEAQAQPSRTDGRHWQALSHTEL